jgi:hypothetical protein
MSMQNARSASMRAALNIFIFQLLLVGGLFGLTGDRNRVSVIYYGMGVDKFH